MTVLLDLRDAHLVASPDLSPVEAKAVAMLVHEVERRTGIALPVSESPGSGPVIVVHRASGMGPSEGYRVTTTDEVVEIQGKDDRETLFGVGP